MKRTKKLLALLLALAMAFTTLVMPALAVDEDEGIMPLGGSGYCSDCGAEVELHVSTRGPTAINASPHDNVAIRHIHEVTVWVEHYHCTACGYDGRRSWQTELCRGGQ